MTPRRNRSDPWIPLARGDRKLDRRLLRRILVIGLTAFAFGYAVTSLLFMGGGSRGPVVTVPDVRRLELDDARRRLSRAGLGLEVGDSLPNPRIPAGAVVAQTPLPGQEVAPESGVQVILSTGREQRAIPDVTRLPRAQAVRVLEASGMRVTVEEVPHRREAGAVVGTRPAVGSPVRLPAAVALQVSAGPPLVAVPEVVGMPEADARGILQAAGLDADPRLELRPHDPEGIVVAQEPLAGDSVRMGSAVGLRVSAHVLPPPETPDAEEARQSPDAPPAPSRDGDVEGR